MKGKNEQIQKCLSEFPNNVMVGSKDVYTQKRTIMSTELLCVVHFTIVHIFVYILN